MSVALKGATRLLAGAGMAVSLLFAAACDDDDDPFVPVVTTITMTSGSPQTVARNGTSTPLTVTVKDQNGDPIAGRTVTWAVATGGGTLTSTSSTTNTQGVATMLIPPEQQLVRPRLRQRLVT